MSKRKFSSPIEEYASEFPIEVRERLMKMRDAVMEMLPEGEECISYKMPTIRLNGKNFIHFGGTEGSCRP